ncbi:MAG: FGGY-family carbohydrate kinase [Aestuariivirga sp.]|uniref:xylulokinase n=1 Tax=Aestuariivirga sp. TaxID=2650926 RepID=UPI0038D0CB73
MLIGIDIGTTAVKAALLDAHGNVMRRFAEAYSTRRPAPGHVEQDPSDWMALVLRALSDLTPHGKAAAVGLCSQVNTHVFTDANGAALFPAITWQDSRATDDAAALDARIVAADKLAWWGAPLPVDASHVLARMAYVARTAPGLWRRTSLVLAPRDYCLLHLTGQAVADPMTNFGILDQRLAPIASLLALVPGAAERLPRIAGFTTLAGHIRPGLPGAGLPVVTGAMDAWAGLYGAGVAEDGQGLYLSGTSEILGIVAPERRPAAGVIAFAPCEGITLHAGPTQAGGAAAAWAASLLGCTPPELSLLAGKALLAHVPLFLPQLGGERAPLWDPGAMGSFTGLTPGTGPAELARAVLEGVAYAARLVFDRLEQSAARGAAVIHHAGGGSASDLWCQVRADVLGKPLRRAANRDAGVLGAALMAGTGTGMFPSLRAAVRDAVSFDRDFAPDPSAADRHARRYEAYQLAYDKLVPVNRLLQ